MRLKNCQTLFGIPVVHLKDYSKKYKLYISLLYFIDIVLVIGITFFMYRKGIDYNTYGFILVAICLGIHFLNFYKIHPEKWDAFKFYNRNQFCEVVEVKYKVDENKLYSILYCSGYRRLKQNKKLEEYKELILSACCENISYSKKIMQYLKKYENVDGNICCYIITKGNKQYFIDFKQEVEEDVNNEGDFTEPTAEAGN